MQKITSAQNKLIKYFYSLKIKKNILIEEKFLVEGKNIIEEAILNDIVIELIISNENLYQDVNIEKIVVTDEIIKKLSFTNTNVGAIAVCKYQPKDVDINSLKKVIVLDEISDPGNLGTIIRTAKAFAFDAIILLNDSTFPYNDKSIRASQGTIFNFPILHFDNLYSLSNFKIYFFVVEQDRRNINEIEKLENEKFALVFGNEATGIRKSTLTSLVGEEITISMSNSVESLNLAVAVGIAINYFFNF